MTARLLRGVQARVPARLAARLAAPLAAPLGAHDPARPVGFMHVPKTAGTSMLLALHDLLRPRVAVQGMDRAMFGGFAAFADFDAAALRQIHPADATVPDAALIAGHFACSTLERYPGAQLMTVLREPMSRALSHWLFWRGYDHALLAGWGAWPERVGLARLSLRDFLSSAQVACQLDNVTARMLLWPHPLIPVDGFIERRHDARLLAEARARLARFAFVDALENPGFGGRLAAWFGRAVDSRHANQTPGMPEPLRCDLAAELTPATVELLSQRSRLDLALWRDVIAARMPDRDPACVRAETVAMNVARYAALAAAPPARA